MNWHEVFPYLLIAPLTAGVGWLTNLLAIKMMFYPVNFVGIGHFWGWQGIIPRLRVHLMRNLVSQSISKICTPSEVVEAFKDEQTLEFVHNLITPYLDDWIDDVLVEENISAWQYSPATLKKVVFDKVQDFLPDIADAILDEFGDQADQLVDFERIAISQVRDRPELLNHLFLRCAGDEMRFIVRSGLWFGFPLGCLQATCWYLFPYNWVLPFFGVIAGASTNWIALKLIAHPAEPRKLGPIRLQGLYLRRQQQVSEEFGAVFTEHFFSPKAFVEHLWHGPRSGEVHRIVHRQVRKTIDRNMISKLAAQLIVSQQRFHELEKKSVEYTADRLLESIDNQATNQTLAKPIATLITRRMQALKPREFQQLLLPAFEQDQLIVVVLGGLLGGAVGFLQLLWLFGNTAG